MDKESGINYYELGSGGVTGIAVKQTIYGVRRTYSCTAVGIASYGVYMAQADKSLSKMTFLPMHAVDEVVISYAEQDKR